MRKCAISWPRSAAGLTLVEAVAGIALLGSMLAAILVTSGRLETQAARSERRVEACRIAEDLLGQWFAKPEKFPRNAEGPVRDRPGWRWRTYTVTGARTDPARKLRADVIAVEVFSPGSPGSPGLAGDPNAAAARVEIVLPAMRQNSESERQSEKETDDAEERSDTG